MPDYGMLAGPLPRIHARLLYYYHDGRCTYSLLLASFVLASLLLSFLFLTSRVSGQLRLFQLSQPSQLFRVSFISLVPRGKSRVCFVW